MAEKRYDTAHFMDNLCRAMRNFDLSWGEMGVLGCLIRHDCPDPREPGERKGVVWCAPGNELQELTGMSERNLRRILNQLAEKQLISRLHPEEAKGRCGKASCWQIHYDRLGWKDMEEFCRTEEIIA